MVANTGEAQEARAAERRTAMAPSTMRAPGLDATDVTVIDLSQTGARIAADAELAIGEEISIGLSGVGTRRAYVAWRREGSYGCAFEKPLAPEEVTEAFSSASVVRLGTPAQLIQATQNGGQVELQELYGAHSLWRIPLDAVLVLGLYLLLFGWASYHYFLPR